MAVSGNLVTYLANGNKPDVSNVIDLISYLETPALSTWTKEPAVNTTVQWYDYALGSPSAANAAVEGADADTASNLTRTVRTNITQILTKVIKVSRTQRQINKYGNVGDEIAWQKKAKLQELARDLDITLMQGVYQAGSSVVERKMRGAEAAITTNATNASSASLTETSFRDNLLKKIWDSAGREQDKIVYANSFQKNIIDGFTGMSNVRVNIGVMNGAVQLPYQVSAYASSFGAVKITLTPHATASVVSCIPLSNFRCATFHGFTSQDLAHTGDNRSVQIVGEYALRHRMQAHAGKIYGLATS